MRIILLYLITLLFNFDSLSQTVSDYINSVKLDSIVKTVRELSGEDSITLNGSVDIINNRISTQNDLAFDYIFERLSYYNLDVKEQPFDTNGKNIIATQLGAIYPDSIYIICAHYDAVAAYCADDNASGTSAVIEAARILSKQCHAYTIVYALWDEEEKGLLGSDFYAKKARSDSQNILGVLNIEMLGFDSNNDGLFEVHSNNSTSSKSICTVVQNLVNFHNLALNETIFNPGTSSSDHASFWQQGYGAVVISQGYYTGDFNPAYHTADDRITSFNIPYFMEMTRLSVGTITTLASPCFPSSIQNLKRVNISLYPNPASSSIKIKGLFAPLTYSIYDVLGTEIHTAVLFTNQEIDIQFLESGLYYIQFVGGYTLPFIKE